MSPGIDRDAELARMRPMVRGMAILAAVHPDQIDDLEQEGLLAAWQALGRYEAGHGAQPSTYAGHRARGAMRDYQRAEDWMSRTQRAQHREDGQGPGGPVSLELLGEVSCLDPALDAVDDRDETASRIAAVMQALEGMSELRRDVVRAYLAGETLTSVAARDGVTVGAVSMRLRHALHELRSKLTATPASVSTFPAIDVDPAPLTCRQLQVVRLVAEGLTDRQIGRVLGISEDTVDSHLRRARDVLEARTRGRLVMAAAALGLVA